MLVLSRKRNESIIIGDNIKIVVIEIRGDKVRLGIEAPKEIPVHRLEVYLAIKRKAQAQADALTAAGGPEITFELVEPGTADGGVEHAADGTRKDGISAA